MTYFDFSFFKNRENLIFFFIYLFIIAIVVLSCAVIIVSIFKSLQKLFRRIFNIEEKVKRIDKDATEESKIIKEDYGKEIANVPKKQVLGNLGRSVSSNEEEPARVMPAQAGGEEEKSTDIVKERRPARHDAAASGGEKEEEGEGDKGKYSIKNASGLEKVGITTEYEKPGFTKDDISSHSAPEAKNLLGFAKEKLGEAKEKPKEAKLKDSSIFEGKSEISRLKLKHELRFNPKVWQAQRQAGLTLSPIERAKLEKEVFSQALGRNISKTDIKWGIEKLNQKMMSTKDLAEKGKLRKEINFFKKIGGV